MNQDFFVHAFRDIKHIPFSADDYSRLKFGSDYVARSFGYEMADAFYHEHFDMLSTKRCIIIPSAFNVVEIAATILAHHFMNRLNDLLSRDGLPIVEWSVMHRSLSYIQDYAHLPKEERAKLLAADKLFINRDYLKGKVLIFVDDVKITGTHEEKVQTFLTAAAIKNTRLFVYYARYAGAAADIEAKLNHSGIVTVKDYLRLIHEPRHHLVVRAVRFLLDIPVADLKTALNRLDQPFIERLYHACIAKGYHEIEGYAEGFALIRQRYDRFLSIEDLRVA